MRQPVLFSFLEAIVAQSGLRSPFKEGAQWKSTAMGLIKIKIRTAEAALPKYGKASHILPVIFKKAD